MTRIAVACGGNCMEQVDKVSRCRCFAKSKSWMIVNVAACAVAAISGADSIHDHLSGACVTANTIALVDILHNGIASMTNNTFINSI